MAKKKRLKKRYSKKTKRHATQFPGVYEREAERVIGKPDIVYDISYKKDGKKIWEKAGWKSQGYSADIARQIRNERIITMQHGDELPKEKKKAITFQALAEKYLKWSAVNKSRDGIDDQSRYDNHLKRLDDKRINDVTPFDLERLKSDMLKEHYAPKTISHCLGLVRSMFNKASDWNLYQGPNPVKKVKKPTIQNTRERFLSFEEADILLKELKRNARYKKEYKELEDPKLHDIALISLHTGARASEIFNLKTQDINFNSELITLRDTKNKETRHAPLTDKVKTMLQRRISSGTNEYIFTDDKGRKIGEVSNAFEMVVNRLKFNGGITDKRQKLVFHSLRHTFASWLAMQGTPIYTIAQLMGHKSITMSERYAHLSPDHKKEAVKNMEIALNGRERVVKIDKARG
jgi:integrase